MLVAVDIGNTHSVIGIYKEDKLQERFRIASNSNQTVDELFVSISGLLNAYGSNIHQIDQVIIGSVVPKLEKLWVDFSRKYLKCPLKVVNANTDLGFKVIIDNPKEIGADRLINTLAGYKVYGGPLIVVDFGTATTFDCISEAGDYLGGVIMPGIGISTDALFNRASKLTQVPFEAPEKVVGTNTQTCVQSGIFFGYSASIDGLVVKIKKELNMPNAKVIATGGFSELISKTCEEINVVDSDLTLTGLLLASKIVK